MQITLNRTEATPPSAFQAGWNERSAGVDTFWNSSVDQDILYYRVYRKFGTNSPALVCQTDPASLTNLITVNSCFDGAAPAPPSPPATCQNPPQSYTTADVYWVVGVDTNPTTGQPRESTVKSAQIDANLCNKPPKAPTGLAATLTGGRVTLTWSAPSAPVDPDAGDTIDAWRIYRWSSAQAGVQYPTYRKEFVDATNSSGDFRDDVRGPVPGPGWPDPEVLHHVRRHAAVRVRLQQHGHAVMRRCLRRASSDERGATLVELLVALSLMLVVFAGVMMAFSIFQRDTANTSARSNAIGQARIAADRIVKSLRNVASTKTTPTLIERAKSYDLVFQTIGSPSGANVQGLQRVRYCVPDDTAGGSPAQERLVAQTQTWTSATPRRTPGRPRPPRSPARTPRRLR